MAHGRGHGVVVAAAVLLGAALGVLAGEPSAGLLLGLGTGVALALLLRARR